MAERFQFFLRLECLQIFSIFSFTPLTALLCDLHGDSFHLCVGLQTILAQFASIARHLEATKSSLGSKNVVAVDPKNFKLSITSFLNRFLNWPNSSSPDTLHEVHGLVNVLGENGSSETILGVISPLEQFIGVLKFDQLLHRAENLSQIIFFFRFSRCISKFYIETYLFFCDSHVVADVGKHCGLNEVSLVTFTSSSRNQSCALFFASVDEAKNLVHLLLVNLRTLLSLGVERVAYDSLLGAGGTLFDKLVVNVFFDEGTRASCAALSLK